MPNNNWLQVTPRPQMPFIIFVQSQMIGPNSDRDTERRTDIFLSVFSIGKDIMETCGCDFFYSTVNQKYRRFITNQAFNISWQSPV